MLAKAFALICSLFMGVSASMVDMLANDPSSVLDRHQTSNIIPPVVNFSEHTFLRASILPSSINRTMHLLTGLIGPKLSNISLGDLKINLEKLSIDIEYTNIFLHNVSFNSSDLAGAVQINGDIFNLTLPCADMILNFDYYQKIGKKGDPRSGNGTLNTTGLCLSMVLKTYLNETDPGTGQLLVQPIHASFNYSTFVMNFTDPWTQLEWDAFFEHPESIMFFLQGVINYLAQDLLSKVDLRRAIVFTNSKNVTYLYGVTNPISFSKINGSAPEDTAIMDVRFHSVIILPDGSIVFGLFNNSMDLPMQSTNYSSIAFSTDFFNKHMHASGFVSNDLFVISQKTLDKINFTLLELDTSSLKPYFPRLEKEYGQRLGVFMRFSSPVYDSAQSHSIATAGRLATTGAVNLQVWVDRNSATYYNDTLDKCIASGSCALAVTVTIGYYINLPLQFTKDVSLTFGYADLELTSAKPFPVGYIEPELFLAKFNNFIDMSLPHLLPSLDLSWLFAHCKLAVDVLDDQRIIFGIQHIDHQP